MFTIIEGTEIVIARIGRTQEEFDRRLDKVLDASVKLLGNAVKKNISLTCHSLEGLAEMGYPYAVRSPFNPHPGSPTYLVHKQSGGLVASMRSGVSHLPGSGVYTGYVGIDETEAPYARYVIMGTRKMVGRNFLTGSLDEVRDEIFNRFINGLRQAIIERRM